MPWTVSILPAATKQLAKIDKSISKRIGQAITSLANNPRPPGCKKLVGVNAWRIRIGDWRVIYQIHEDRLVVLVLRSVIAAKCMTETRHCWLNGLDS